MTQQNKELLLKDLCARLPYGVLCDYVYNIGHPQKLLSISLNEKCQIHLDSDEYEFDSGKSYGPSEIIVEDCKPYLRPMSSMTDEEENEYRAINCYEGLFPCNEDALDYVLSHHLDFRSLIPMGLALKAPADMYKQIKQ